MDLRPSSTVMRTFTFALITMSKDNILYTNQGGGASRNIRCWSTADTGSVLTSLRDDREGARVAMMRKASQGRESPGM